MPSIFVTGAGKGIGRAIAERFATEGWQVEGVTRTQDDVDRLNCLPRARFHRADAADAGAMAGVAAGRRGHGRRRRRAQGRSTRPPCQQCRRLPLRRVPQYRRGDARIPLARQRTDGLRGDASTVAGIASRPRSRRQHCLGRRSQAAGRQGGLFRHQGSAGGAVPVPARRDRRRRGDGHQHLSRPDTSSFEGEEVDPATMLSPADVAEAVFRNCTAGGNLGVEELVLQPASGIRL